MLVVRREQERRELQSESGKDVREISLAALACPTERVAAVERVLDGRVCSEVWQCDDCLALSCLRGEVDGGHAFSVTWSPEGTALIRIGAKCHRGCECSRTRAYRSPHCGR